MQNALYVVGTWSGLSAAVVEVVETPDLGSIGGVGGCAAGGGVVVVAAPVKVIHASRKPLPAHP